MWPRLWAMSVTAIILAYAVPHRRPGSTSWSGGTSSRPSRPARESWSAISGEPRCQAPSWVGAANNPPLPLLLGGVTHAPVRDLDEVRALKFQFVAPPNIFVSALQRAHGPTSASPSRSAAS